MVDARARAKHLEQGHIADHMLERVSSHYADLRLLQHQTAQRNNLGSNTSTEDEKIGWPLVKRKMPWQPLHPAPKQLMAKLHQLLVGVLEVWVMGWGAAFQPASSSLFLATLALRAPCFLILLSGVQMTVMRRIQEALHHPWTMKW